MPDVDRRPFADIALDFPIAISGVSVSVLRMRRPLVRDQIAIEAEKGPDGLKSVRHFARLCEVTPDDIMNLDAIDFEKLAAQQNAFLGKPALADSAAPSSSSPA